jgi:hypothetical protein
MFRIDLLSIIRSFNTVYRAIGICHASYVDCLLLRSGWKIEIWEIVHLKIINLRNSTSRRLLCHDARSFKCQFLIKPTNYEFPQEGYLLCQSIDVLVYYFTYHHHSVFCLTTGSKPPPKRFLHIVRSRASSFKWEYPLLFVRSSSSFLRLLPHLFFTSISPFIFLSITCFRRQFLRKMWPIQVAFCFLFHVGYSSAHWL